MEGIAISNNTYFISLPHEMLSHYITAIYVSFSDTGYNITIFITIFILIVIIQHTKFLAVQYNDCHILGIKVYYNITIFITIFITLKIN